MQLLVRQNEELQIIMLFLMMKEEVEVLELGQQQEVFFIKIYKNIIILFIV